MDEFRPSLSYTFLLFARPSFVEGIARILDFGGTLQAYNRSRSTRDADLNALRSDWRAIGSDIQRSMGEYEQEESRSHPA